MLKRFGFTLAEVLITLGIIGIVAAMTIPTLVADYQERSFNTAASTFNRKLGEALRVMNLQGSLRGYTTTKDFVNELSKHIKIVKICEETTDCFPSEIHVNNDVVDMTKIISSENLNKGSEYDTEVLGLQFANGVNALIAYNPDCKQDPFNNGIIGISGTKSNVTLGTDAISILFDVSGFKSPNEYANNKDIRGINVSLNIVSCTAKIDGKCIVVGTGTGYPPVDCSAAASETDDYKKYCGDYPSGFTDDYWAGSQKFCDSQGLRMPSRNETQVIYEELSASGYRHGDIYWYWNTHHNLCSDNYKLAPHSGLSSGCYQKNNTESNRQSIICVE